MTRLVYQAKMENPLLAVSESEEELYQEGRGRLKEAELKFFRLGGPKTQKVDQGQLEKTVGDLAPLNGSRSCVTVGPAPRCA
jgi:hypothetical protein